MDYVQRGTTGFARNTGSQFWDASWGFAQTLETPSGIDAEEEDNYQRTYYQQEPLRRWTAYRSGTVEVRGRRLRWKAEPAVTAWC